MTTTNTELLIGREALLAALRQALLELPERAPRRVTLLDVDLADWPLDEPAVLEAMTRWARLAGRQLRLIALDYEALARRRPRFANWRRDWGHCVEAWSPNELGSADMPAWLLAGDRAVQWLERQHWRGRWVSDAAALHAMDEATDAILQRSQRSWAVTTLGL